MEPSELTEYSPDQQRVSDYIQQMTNGIIGSGPDPIGFLLASHAYYREIIDELTKELRASVKTTVNPSS